MNNKEIFSNRRPGIIGEEKFRQYAVLIPMVERNGQIYVLFEKRSQQLRRQPGEICFPGGKLEEGETIQECAVRETVEELLIENGQIDVVGPSDIFLSPFGIVVHPFLGQIRDYNGSFSTDEVEETIEIPITFFLENLPRRFQTELINSFPEDFPYDLIPGGENYKFAKGKYEIIFYEYEEWIIWGMTAQMAKSAVDLIVQYQLL